jgi:tetratricopeptide (TPR) repeat protein
MKYFICCCFVLPCLSLAQTPGFSGGPAILLAPFKYIAPASAEKAASEPVTKRAENQQRIVDLNSAGDYQSVGTNGLTLMSNEKIDDELQLIVANSLAWTGRLKEAIPIFQSLSNGKYANEANVGIANISRWRGRDDQALPLYKSVLEKDPTNVDALEGVALASRELSPRTTVGLGGSSDSSDLIHRSGFINHRWRNDVGTNIFEVEVSGVRDRLLSQVATEQDITVRYQGLDLALKPSLEISMPAVFNPRLYGSGRIKLFDDQVSLGAGVVNWGKMSTSPSAMVAGLSANYLGADANLSFSMGSLTARVDYYSISDTNAVVTSGLNFNSAWRPLGTHFRPFAGIETRVGQYSTTDYWSPVDGSGTAYVGLLGDWGGPEWNLFASAQLGTRLYGDAGRSWSIVVGGKYWLTSDVALNGNLWSMSSFRDNAAYKAQSLNLSLEKIWR